MDCGRGSLVKLCGLRGLNFTIHTPLWSHTAPALAYVLSCRPPTSSSAWIGRLLSGQSTHQTTWAASDVTVVTDTELKLVFQCYLRCVGRHGVLLLPTSCPFRAFQVASKDRPWDNYRHYALFRTEGVLVYVYWWLRATDAVNSVCASEQQTCQMCVRSPYCPTSCYFMTEKRH